MAKRLLPPEQRRREGLTRLLPTPAIEDQRAAVVKAGGDAAYLTRQLADAMERDRLAEGRPEGCWCLGVGGRSAICLSRGDEDLVVVYEEHCSCTEGEAAQEQDDATRTRLLAARHAHYVADTWEREIPERLRGWRLDSSGVRPDLVARLGHDRDSWYIWGPVGTGKTGLAVGYARSWLEQMREPAGDLRFVTLPDLLAELRACYRDDGLPEEAVVACYRSAGLLVLDDLGAEQLTGSGWVEDRLYRIIGWRHDHLRQTVYTSNYSLGAMAARIGERLSWRIVEMCGPDGILHLSGPNWRDHKAGPR